MAPQFTESVQEAFEKAILLAQEHRHTEISENHLLRSFFQDPQGYFSLLSSALNLHPETLLPQLESALKKLPAYTKEPEQPVLSAHLQSQIAQAQELAREWKDTYISSDHF